ncbi:MAG: hypothetical protein KDA24_25460 [Deltaproteobacteria bacterium]|nr:hypothetical protein [Deltaproteobacteria bacterium]
MSPRALVALSLILGGCSDASLRAAPDEAAAAVTEDEAEAGPERPPGLSDFDGDCAPVAWLSCGDEVSADLSDPTSGRTDAIDFYPVAVGNYMGPEIAYAFRPQAAEEARLRLLDPTPMELDLDLFVIDGPFACSAANARTRGFNDVRFDVVPDEVVFLVLDGFDGDAGAFDARLECDGPQS